MADLSLDKAMLHGGARKNSLRPLQRRDLVPELMQRFGCSQRNALRIVQMSASTYLYRSVARDATVLTARIKEITETRVHYGYRRVHVLLRREGHPDNVKRVSPLSRSRAVAKAEAPATQQGGQMAATQADLLGHQRALEHGPCCRCTVRWAKAAHADSRRLLHAGCLAIDVGQSLKAEDVVASLNRICALRGLPVTIKTDNGSEFISRAMDKWAYDHGVELDFSRPGKPTDNARVESSNGRLRQECLNAHWFLSMEDARAKIDAWRNDYNESRPHSALDWIPPTEFARRCRPQPATTTATTWLRKADWHEPTAARS